MTLSFEGDWEIDLTASEVWDPATRGFIPDQIGQELISIRLDGDVQTYEVLLGDRPTIRMGYTSRYDSTDWVPYSVREIVGADEDHAIDQFIERTKQRKTDFKVGDIYGMVRTIFVDERTHYRLSKDAATGDAEYIMLRRLDDDGQSYRATVFRVDGQISIRRRFIRR